DVHVALHLAAAAGVDEFLGRLRDDGVAVVVEPVDQGTDRRIFLIFDDRGVIERAQQGSTALEFLEQTLVVNVEAERLGGCVEVGAINKERDLIGRRGHSAFSHGCYRSRSWRSGSGPRISKKTNSQRLAMPVEQALPQLGKSGQ